MKDTEKLKNIIGKIDELIAQRVYYDSISFKAWKNEAERFLINHYGQKSYECDSFTKIRFMVRYVGTVEDQIAQCAKGLAIAKEIFTSYLTEMEEEQDYIQSSDSFGNRSFKKVFVVHGHDGELKEAVARMVEKQGIEAIILSEQANRGATIIEKIENNSDVGAAICLFTTDDSGKSNTETDYHSRARQNVVFEAGYFMGKLGRENVVMISDPDIEIPSDLSGVVYTNKNFWQVEVLKELSEMGFSIDLNKLL